MAGCAFHDVRGEQFALPTAVGATPVVVQRTSCNQQRARRKRAVRRVVIEPAPVRWKPVFLDVLLDQFDLGLLGALRCQDDPFFECLRLGALAEPLLLVARPSLKCLAKKGQDLGGSSFFPKQPHPPPYLYPRACNRGKVLDAILACLTVSC